jgi:hypothetical protein
MAFLRRMVLLAAVQLIATISVPLATISVPLWHAVKINKARFGGLLFVHGSLAKPFL